MEFLIAAAIFCIVGGLVFLLLAPKARVQEERIQRRLEAITAGEATAIKRAESHGEDEETLWERITSFFFGGKELAPQNTNLHRLLHQAGYDGEKAVRIFWGVRISLAGAFAAGAILFTISFGATVPKMMFLVATATGLGFFLPYFRIRRKAAARTRRIQEALPDALDLLVICVEAGLGVDAALVRVAKEHADRGLAIGDELQLTSQEIHTGIVRREALGRMADRIGLDEIRGLVTFLIQTEQLGGSIARSLRVYAMTMRQKRSQRAEEAARKAVIKLIFPLVLFILPALFLVVLGPPVINMVKFFGKPMG
jgi:tight adherence protein C